MSFNVFIPMFNGLLFQSSWPPFHGFYSGFIFLSTLFSRAPIQFCILQVSLYSGRVDGWVCVGVVRKWIGSVVRSGWVEMREGERVSEWAIYTNSLIFISISTCWFCTSSIIVTFCSSNSRFITEASVEKCL